MGLLAPTGVLADSIHLEVSSSLSSPGLPRESHVTITASGSASSTSDEIHVSSPPSGEQCPHNYPGGEEERIKHWMTPISSWEFATTPNYNIDFYFSGGSNPLICGYLTDAKETKEYSYTYETVTLASTELQVAYSPSEKEIKEKKQQEEAAQRKYEEEAPARQAAQRAAEAQAKERAIEQIRNTPVSKLSVKAIPRPQHSHEYPGHTNLEITTNPYAYVTVKLVRFGHLTENYEWGQSGRRPISVKWTCKLPGGRYHYTVISHSNVGRSLIRRGTFSPVSSSHCQTLKREETEARERGERRYAEEQRRIERAERELLKQWESNCRAAGGTPITLHTPEGTLRACRASSGGLIPVPI
jgi:hypothetical protein